MDRMRPVDLESFRSWLDRYFAAWSSNDAGAVGALFAEDAEYSSGPFRESLLGREAIVRAWVDGGAQPGLRTRHEAIAVRDDRGVAHWSVAFANDAGGTTEIDGILVCTFDGTGRCTRHEEWFDRRETASAPP
jgi:ketosteroid isomerase-like protein